VVLTATKTSIKPVWITFTLDESDDNPLRLGSGELVEDAARWALRSGVRALLFNCCRPEVVDAAVRVAKEVVGEEVRVGAYANAFEPKPKMNHANEVLSGIREDLDPAQYARYTAARWAESGATIVGGCRGIGCEHIRQVATAFRERRTVAMNLGCQTSDLPDSNVVHWNRRPPMQACYAVKQSSTFDCLVEVLPVGSNSSGL
jgi:S-methylmethionine-dependent homocysteine/selenocysteine methylase